VQAQADRKVDVWWSKSREEPWRAQAASTRQSRSNPIFGEIGSTQFLEQGFTPCSFFVFRRASRPALFCFSQGFTPCSFLFSPRCSIAACAGFGHSIYRRGVIQISASLDRAFFAANLQLERIRASVPRCGRVCEISTLPERDRAMLWGFKQIQSLEDRVAAGTKIARARRSCGGPD
jgi:hypothetical protein